MDTEQFLLIGGVIAMIALFVIVLAWSGVIIEKMSKYVHPDIMRHLLDTVKDISAQQAVTLSKRTKTELDDMAVQAFLTQNGYTIEEQSDGTWKPIRKSAPIDPPQ